MKTLANPPITEAIAQINFQTLKPVEDSDLAKVASAFKGHQQQALQQILVNPNAAPVMSQFGFKLSEPNRNEFIQITRDFFNYASTAKYQSWDKFKPDVTHAMATFLANVQATNISRIALRYINKFEFSGSLEQLSAALQFYPVLGPMGEKAPDSTVTTYTVPIGQDSRANVILRLDRSGENRFQVHLDVDSFTQSKFRPAIDVVMAEFERLRSIKNDIFEKSLTSATLATFDK